MKKTLSIVLNSLFLLQGGTCFFDGWAHQVFSVPTNAELSEAVASKPIASGRYRVLLSISGIRSEGETTFNDPDTTISGIVSIKVPACSDVFTIPVSEIPITGLGLEIGKIKVCGFSKDVEVSVDFSQLLYIPKDRFEISDGFNGLHSGSSNLERSQRKLIYYYKIKLLVGEGQAI